MMYTDFRIAVIGDFLVDEWWRAESMKICPEAPVPDLINPVLVMRSAGGAGNVVRNLLSLGAQVDCYGIFGRDDAGYALWNELQSEGANWRVDPVDGFETHRKIRYVSDGQMVFRVSRDRCRAVSEVVRVNIDDYDAFIVSDYNKGAMTPETINTVMRGAQEKPVFVDPKFDNLEYYAGAKLIKFNKAEALAAMKNGEYSIAALQRKLTTENRQLRTNIVVTLGHVGMEVIDAEGEIYDIPGREVGVADVTGAGDTAIAVLTLEFLRTKNLVESAFLANYACSLVVQKRMTAVVTPEELEAARDE